MTSLDRVHSISHEDFSKSTKFQDRTPMGSVLLRIAHNPQILVKMLSQTERSDTGCSGGQKSRFWPKKGQKHFSTKKWILPNFNIYYSLTPFKKSENFNHWILRNSKKPYFWANSGGQNPVFGPKRAKKIFPKKMNTVTF